jgi:hypothetical protein
MNEGQTVAQLVFWLLGLGGALLSGAVWYLIRRYDNSLAGERQERLAALKEERLAREVALKEERDAREEASREDRKLFLELFERANVTWMQALDREREQAKSDRHEFRDELSKWANLFQAYKLEAAEKFVNRTSLIDALQPLKDTIEGFRSDMRDLFVKIDGKADKSTRPVGH